ncbi:MAG: hypothetical protein NTV22_17755 [bacterium]|nr:hypothetical protein [bacterium]
MKLFAHLTAMIIVTLAIAGAASPAAGMSADPATTNLDLAFGCCRLGKGVRLALSFNTSQTLEFPRDTFRVAISNVPLIEALYLDNPHFWHRNRFNTEFRYLRTVPQSGPVSVIINVKKKTCVVRIYNYANLFLEGQALPITIQLGTAVATYNVWFDNVGKPIRIHHRNDPVTPAAWLGSQRR